MEGRGMLEAASMICITLLAVGMFLLLVATVFVMMGK